MFGKKDISDLTKIKEAALVKKNEEKNNYMSNYYRINKNEVDNIQRQISRAAAGGKDYIELPRPLFGIGEHQLDLMNYFTSQGYDAHTGIGGTIIIAGW